MRTLPAVVLLAVAAPGWAQTIFWANPASGLWTDPSNWSPTMVPNAAAHAAQIAVPGAYTVMLASAVTVQSLSITNPSAVVEVGPGGTLGIRTGGLATSGVVRVRGTGASPAALSFDPGAPLTGTGRITLDGNSVNAGATLWTPNAMTVGPGLTVGGHGLLMGQVTNNGEIVADMPGRELEVGSTVINNLTVRAAPGATLLLTGYLHQTPGSGELRADGGTVNLIDAGISGGRITGAGAGLVDVGGPAASSFLGVTIESGTVGIRGGSSIDIFNGLTVNGLLRINSNASTSTAAAVVRSGSIDGTGTIHLNGPGTVSQAQIGAYFATLTLGPGLTISGRGSLGDAACGGRITPGGTGGTAIVAFRGLLTLQPSASLEIELRGVGSEFVFDALVGINNAGPLALDGTLRIRTINNFVPVPGQSWVIASTPGGITGAFAAVDAPPVGNVAFRVSYEPTAVRLIAGCYANCDGSTGAPVLNVNDFVCFQSRFAAGEPYANCDGSTEAPVLNVNDFVCFQGRFAAGCQ